MAVKQQGIVLLDYNSKDISVFAFGFFCLQLTRFVFCICAVLYDDRGVYASRRCLSISILSRGMTTLVFVILARLSPLYLIVLTICYVGLLHFASVVPSVYKNGYLSNIPRNSSFLLNSDFQVIANNTIDGATSKRSGYDYA